jgi:hypothetical protein
MLRSVDTNLPYRIVVVAGCHFSLAAMREIKADPLLHDAFVRGNAIWLTPDNEEIDVEGMRDWNLEFPDQPIAVAYDNGTWPSIDFFAIPTFYFFKDGKLVSSSVGWKRDMFSMLPPSWLEEPLSKMGLLY